MIYRNAIRCKHCGETIESVSRWDFVTCKCGKVSVDGGHDYLRRCANSPDDYEELSETVPDEDVVSDENDDLDDPAYYKSLYEEG